MVNGLFEFIKNSPSAYQTVDTIRKMLDACGYKRLSEEKEYDLKVGGKYYVIRSGTSIIAFRVPENPRGFMIVASHSDSPSFRLKMHEEKLGAYTRLSTERYGGMILYSWLDRPLSLAGRVIVDTGSGVGEELVNLDMDLLTIPSLTITYTKQRKHILCGIKL